MSGARYPDLTPEQEPTDGVRAALRLDGSISASDSSPYWGGPIQSRLPFGQRDRLTLARTSAFSAAKSAEPYRDSDPHNLIVTRSQSSINCDSRDHKTHDYGATRESIRVSTREQIMHDNTQRISTKSRLRKVRATGSPFQLFTPAMTPKQTPVRLAANSAGSASVDTGMALWSSLTNTPILSPFDIQRLMRSGDGKKESDAPLAIAESTPLLAKKRVNGSEEEIELIEGTLSWQSAVCAILNVFLGLALLSYPYAVAQGGLISLPVLAVLCLGACYTGKLMIRCFESPMVRVVSYPAVGFVAFQMRWGMGWLGRTLISVGIMMEFVGGCIVSNVFISRNVSVLLPDDLLSDWEISLLVFAVTVPSVMVLQVSEMRFHAIVGFIAKVSVVIMVLFTFVYCQFTDTITNPNGKNSVELMPDSATALSVGTGIFILSLSGHPCLPEVYHKMADPSEFDFVLDVCFGSMFALYSLMGTAGFMLFGRKDTSPVITESLNELSSEGPVFSAILKILIALVTVGCYSSVIPALALISDIPEYVMGIDESPMLQRVLRVTELAVIVLLAHILSNQLPYVEAISGSMFTMITSCIMPPLCCFIFGKATEPLTKSVMNIAAGVDRRSHTEEGVPFQLDGDTSNEKPVEKMGILEVGLYYGLIGFGLIAGIYLVYNDVVGLMNGGSS